MNRTFDKAELRERSGVPITRVTADVWNRKNGLRDEWGGTLRPHFGDVLTITSGQYHLMLPGQGEHVIDVVSVNTSADVRRGGVVSSAEFLGSGDAPELA